MIVKRVVMSCFEPTCPSAADPVSFFLSMEPTQRLCWQQKNWKQGFKKGRRVRGKMGRRKVGRRQQMTEQVETGQTRQQGSKAASKQAHLRQTNKPDPAGSLLSTTPLTPRFHPTIPGHKKSNVKGRT